MSEKKTTSPQSNTVHVLVSEITPEVVEQLEKRYDLLGEQEQAFVDGAPSTLRRTLRIAQIELAKKGSALCGQDGAHLMLAADKKGCPYFTGDSAADAGSPNGLFVSVSHSDNALAVAVSPFRIGVDIENQRVMPPRPITLLFSPEEQEAIFDDDSFTRAWVRKEAYAKWLGTGLCDTLASGVYDTETFTAHYLVGERLHYLGLAGAHCATATITEVTL